MEPSNVLHIKSLGKGWSDKDNIMLHACFQLLVDCVKDKKFLGSRDWDGNEDNKIAKAKIEELCKWWEDRLSLEANDTLDEIWVEGQHEKDTIMLVELVGVRKYLWS
ncbi:MAG: hypothetical protein ACI9RM_001088 [Ulvibacter sp.]|jgi:hypothetical protein